jgi:hypothetical protein
MLDERGLRDVLGDVPEFAYLKSSPEKPILAEELARKREIWRTLIWATFLVIGVEFLVATLRPQRASPSAGDDRGPDAASPARWIARIGHTLRGAPAEEKAMRDKGCVGYLIRSCERGGVKGR